MMRISVLQSFNYNPKFFDELHFWPNNDCREKLMKLLILRGTWIAVQNVMVIHPVVVIFVWVNLRRHCTQNHKCQPHCGTMGNVMGSSWLLKFIVRGPWLYLHNFMAICWSNIQFDQHYHWFVHLKREKLQKEQQRRDGHAIDVVYSE